MVMYIANIENQGLFIGERCILEGSVTTLWEQNGYICGYDASQHRVFAWKESNTIVTSLQDTKPILSCAYFDNFLWIQWVDGGCQKAKLYIDHDTAAHLELYPQLIDIQSDFPIMHQDTLFYVLLTTPSFKLQVYTSWGHMIHECTCPVQNVKPSRLSCVLYGTSLFFTAAHTLYEWDFQKQHITWTSAMPITAPCLSISKDHVLSFLDTANQCIYKQHIDDGKRGAWAQAHAVAYPNSTTVLLWSEMEGDFNRSSWLKDSLVSYQPWQLQLEPYLNPMQLPSSVDIDDRVELCLDMLHNAHDTELIRENTAHFALFLPDTHRHLWSPFRDTLTYINPYTQCTHILWLDPFACLYLKPSYTASKSNKDAIPSPADTRFIIIRKAR